MLRKQYGRVTVKPWVDKRTARMCSNMVYETELGSVGPEMRGFVRK